MVTPRTMPGVLELLPAEQVVFNRMLEIIRRVYERFGFLPVETPAIELTDILLTKTGGETERQMYFVQSTGSLEQGSDPDLALNFDLTVPLARYVAEHQHDLAFPFRRYQIQRVYRGESPQRGRWREFYQCDIDVVDRDSLDIMYDAEMPAVINSVFDELGIGDFTIRLNNRKLMRGLMGACGVESPATQAAALREIDKLDKRGADWVRDSLTSLGIARVAAEAVLSRVSVGAMERTRALDWLESLEGGDTLLVQGIEEAQAVLRALPKLGVPDDRYVLDPAIARGLDYYTGTVYETSLDAHPEVGSICSGGRYDDLAGLYTSTRLPGVGISIGLTRLFGQLRDIGLLRTEAPLAAMVTLMDQEGMEYTLDVASRLRAAGINTTAVLTPGKLGKQLKHADRLGARFAIIAGSNERAAGTVTIKDLVRQTQAETAVGEAARHILDNY